MARLKEQKKILTPEQRSFLTDLVSFIDWALVEDQDFDHILFMIAHDVQGYGSRCFLPRTHNWKKKHEKKYEAGPKNLSDAFKI